MGKGTIISGGTDGWYQVEVNFFRDKINGEIAALEVRIDVLTERIASLPDGTERDVVKLQRNGLEKRKDFLENNIPADETISAWCADFSEELTGNVGTVEVPGERGTVLIQPGHGGNATYSTARDGQLLPVTGASFEQYFYNLAMLPGWQKWKPTFRFGVIDSRDGDHADVTLEAAASSQQSLDVNQTTSLSAVPIEYMACDGGVFEAGDAVLIMFENQDWQSPKIIGFKNNPKPCYPWVIVSVYWDAYGTNTSFVWDIEANAFATTIPDGLGRFVSMPCEYEDLTYWRGITIDVTIDRHWTPTVLEHPLDHIYFPERGGDSGSQYIEYEENYCSGVVIPSYISRSWLFTSDVTYTDWEPDPETYPRCRIIEATGTRDESDDRYIVFKGFCFNSKIKDALDFKVNLSEEITERTKDIGIYQKVRECHYAPIPPDWRVPIINTWLKNIFTFVYEEARKMTLETPIGDIQIFSVSEPNSIAYEDDGAGENIIRGDFDNTLYEAEIRYFGASVSHSDTTICQLYVLRGGVTHWHSTREGASLPGTMGIDYPIKNLAKTGDIVEEEEEKIVEVLCSIGIEEDGIIEGEYDPKTGIINEELSSIIKQIIVNRDEDIHSLNVRFRM